MRDIKMTVDSNCIELLFPSSIDMIREVVESFVTFIGKKSYDIDIFSFKLVLFEILTNAVKHGNEYDSSLMVKISLHIESDYIRIVVEDCGNGFDWKSAMMEHECKASNPRGRGLLLLKAYDYTPCFNEQGNILTIKKSIA